MYKNYFYLLRAVETLEPIIQGKKIIEVYTQEKDKLFFHIPIQDHPYFHVIVSTSPQQQFIAVREDHHKAKKNTINFFSEFLPSTVESIRMALGDRLIELVLSESKLYIQFRGGDSNILLLDHHNNFHSFKKVDPSEKEKVFREISKTKLNGSFPAVISQIESYTDENLIRKLPFLGKDILKEADLRHGNFKKNLLEIIREIRSENIVVCFDEIIGKPIFLPKSFSSVKKNNENQYANYFEALNKYFSLSYSQSAVKNVSKEIEKYLNTEIKRLSNKLNNLKARIEAGTKENQYRQFGNLLLANINLLKKGMKEIILSEYGSETETKIKLDDKLSPQQNIDRFYEKSRAEKIEFQKSKEFFSVAKKEYERLIQIREKFEKVKDQDDLIEIKNELKIKTQASGENQKYKISFRRYLLEGKYHLFVGKDSKNNDLLTTQFAKQNDFWFHARSVSGSHVVLRVENSKEAIPKNILQKAAQVAAFYSKAKTSKLAPVTYTLKKYVNKSKRHEPGQVTVTKENVLLVRPEIPKDCEPMTD